MLGRDEKMQPEFVDFPNFAQGFGFASREAISEARDFSKTHQVRFRQFCDTGGLTPFGRHIFPLLLKKPRQIIELQQ